MIGFLKKPWWVGPLIAGVSYNHYHADKPPEPAAVSGYEVVHNRGNLPHNGRVVVVATCPAGKRAISGGFSGRAGRRVAETSCGGGVKTGS